MIDKKISATRKSILFALEFFKGRDDLVIAEIGVQAGRNSENLWTVLKPKLLLLIDAWDPDRNQHNDEVYLETWRTMHGHREVIIIKGWSVDVAKIIGLKFDLVYVDGCHDESNVKEDINAWLPKIKEGGILCGHDYFNIADVKKVVDEIFGDRVNSGYPPEGASEGADWWVMV